MKIKEKINIDIVVSGTEAAMISGDAGGFIESISTDTRTLSGGDFFIPVEGDNFDGHAFIGDAFKGWSWRICIQPETKKKNKGDTGKI